MSFNNTKTPLKPKDNSKQRYVVPMRRCKAGPMEFYIPDDMKEQFCKHFRDEMNRTVMEWYGISFSTLQRLKRELGIVKDLAKVKHKQAMRTKRLLEKNGYYDSLRGKSPSQACIEGTKRSWRNRRKHPMEILKEKNPRKYKKSIEKRSRLRKELIAKERRRYEFTLMPISNIPTHIYSCKYEKSAYNKRMSAKKRGYVLGSIEPEYGERMMIFYTDKTQRSEQFERNCIKSGFEIRAIHTRGKLLRAQEDHNALLSE